MRVRHRRQATLVRVRVAYLLSAFGSSSCTTNYFKIMDLPTCQIAAAYVRVSWAVGSHTVTSEGPSGCYVHNDGHDNPNVYLNLNLTGAGGSAYQPLCAGPPRPPNMRIGRFMWEVENFLCARSKFPMCEDAHTPLCRLSIPSAAPAPHARVRAAGNGNSSCMPCSHAVHSHAFHSHADLQAMVRRCSNAITFAQRAVACADAHVSRMRV